MRGYYQLFNAQFFLLWQDIVMISNFHQRQDSKLLNTQLFIMTGYYQLFNAQFFFFFCHDRILSWFQTFTVFWMLYAFFWVFLRRLNFICQRFGTLCLFHLHRQVGMKNFFIPTCLWRWNRQGVPKHWHIKFRRRGITQKIAYNMILSIVEDTCLWRWNR